MASRFENAVTLGGRLADSAVRVPGANEQARFTLAYPFRSDRAYFFEVNCFDELAVEVLGEGESDPLRKGDTILLEGRLASYNRPVVGVKGRFHVTRVTVVATTIQRVARGSAHGPPPPTGLRAVLPPPRRDFDEEP